MAKNKYKLRTITCEGCGITHTDNMPLGRKYCSVGCLRNSKKPHRKTGQILNCDYCNQPVYRKKNELLKNKNNFCSHACANAFQAKNKLAFECKTCSKTFYWSKSRIKDNNPTYCCIECRNNDNDWVIRATTNANLAQQSKKGPNKLELLGRQLLLKENIIFQEQVIIAEKILVDVLIEDCKIIIQWDGDYWHGHPNKLKNNQPDKRQKKRMDLDKSQDAYLKKCGYNVIRFWESEVIESVKTDSNYIIEKIKKQMYNQENRED